MNKTDVRDLIRLLHLFRDDQERRVPFGEELCSALLQCVPMPSIECVIARLIHYKIEVFLTRRSSDDPFYANLWHVPGTFLRLREQVWEAMMRVSRIELVGASITKYQCIMPNNNWREPRGHSVGLVYLCEMEGQPVRGEWFQVWPQDCLPSDFIQFQRDFIMPALGPLFIDRVRPA